MPVWCVRLLRKISVFDFTLGEKEDDVNSHTIKISRTMVAARILMVEHLDHPIIIFFMYHFLLRRTLDSRRPVFSRWR